MAKKKEIANTKQEEQIQVQVQEEVAGVVEGTKEEDLSMSGVQKILEKAEALIAEVTESPKSEPESNWWEPKTITVRELVQKARGGFLNFKTAYQRKAGVGHWKKPEQIDRLLDSVMRGWFIGAFLWRVDFNATKKQDIVDSLQRITSILAITDPELPHIPRTLEGDFEHLNGSPYVAWAEEDKKRFLDQRILIIEIDEADDDNIVEYFVRINKGGVPLTTSEAKRAKYLDKAKALAPLTSQKQYSFWELVRKNITLNAQEVTFMKLYNSLYEKTPDHASNTVVDWFINFEMKTSHVEELRTRLTMFNNIVKKVRDMENGESIAKRFCKPTQLLTIVPLLTDSQNVQRTAETLHEFFGRSAASKNGNEEAKKYKALCLGGTASSESIRKRKEFMTKLLASAKDVKVA